MSFNGRPLPKDANPPRDMVGVDGRVDWGMGGGVVADGGMSRGTEVGAGMTGWYGGMGGWLGDGKDGRRTVKAGDWRG